jgi:regulator of sigma E protease
MSSEIFSSLFGNLWSVFMIVLFFGGSIFVHELGHFLAARKRGLKVDRFSIGFGPAIFSWRGKDGVEYRLSWLPLGGYVALPQLADMSVIEGKEVQTPLRGIHVTSGPVDSERNLPPISYSTRMIVFAAGAFFNVLFAFLLASILWFVGQPTSEENSTTRIGYIFKTLTLADSSEIPSPAIEAGLRVGDTIRALDGTKVSDWPGVMQTLITSAGRTEDGRRKTVFSIERDGQPMDITVYPRLAGDDNIRKVGIIPAYTLIVANVPEKSDAQALGLKVDDQLKLLNGVPLLNLVTLMDTMQAKDPKDFTLTVQRDTRLIEIKVPKDSTNLLGANFRTNFGLLHTNPFQQIANQASSTVRVLWSLVQPHSDIGLSKLSGPVGIGKIYWDAAQAGIRYVLWIAILVNVNLAIFNLLPIPVLDGGHMLFATIGKIRGRALPVNFIAAAQSVFIVLLFSMILYVSVFDVRRIARDSHNNAQSKEVPAEQKKAAEPATP